MLDVDRFTWRKPKSEGILHDVLFFKWISPGQLPVLIVLVQCQATGASSRPRLRWMRYGASVPMSYFICSSAGAMQNCPLFNLQTFLIMQHKDTNAVHNTQCCCRLWVYTSSFLWRHKSHWLINMEVEKNGESATFLDGVATVPRGSGTVQLCQLTCLLTMKSLKLSSLSFIQNKGW